MGGGGEMGGGGGRGGCYISVDSAMSQVALSIPHL